MMSVEVLQSGLRSFVCARAGYRRKYGALLVVSLKLSGFVDVLLSCMKDVEEKIVLYTPNQ